MDLFGVKRIMNRYKQQTMNKQYPFQAQRGYRGREPNTNFFSPPQHYYKFITGSRQRFQIPNNIEATPKGQQQVFLPNMEYPLTALGLLIVQTQEQTFFQIGVIFQQNYVIANYTKDLQILQDANLTFYPAFNKNQYIECYKAEIITTDQSKRILYLQIKAQDNLSLIFGQILFKTDIQFNKQHKLDDFPQRARQQQEPDAPEYYREPRYRPRQPRPRNPRRNSVDRMAVQVPVSSKIKIFNFDLLKNNNLVNTQTQIAQPEFLQWIGKYGVSGLCFKTIDDQQRLIGVLFNHSFISIRSSDIQLFNETINGNKYELKCSQLSQQQSIWIFQKKWKNLVELHLTANKINPSLCSYISTTTWPQLKQLKLSTNPLGTQGIFFLTKASFPRLQILWLQNTLIDDQGCERLSKSRWVQLRKLNLSTNMIRQQGCKWLSNAEWPHLKQLDIKHNKFRGEGCKHLVNAPWKLLKINLSSCLIDDVGCMWLIRSKWTSLQHINLQDNQITSLGCKWLKKGNWKNVTNFRLANNKLINKQGMQHISHLNCTNLYQFSININDTVLPANYPLLKVQFPYLCFINKKGNQGYQRRTRRRREQEEYVNCFERYFKEKFKYLNKTI